MIAGGPKENAFVRAAAVLPVRLEAAVKQNGNARGAGGTRSTRAYGS